MEERDNSPDAIRRRYDKANAISIVCQDRFVFDSLRDIFYLLKQNEMLLEELTSLKESAKIISDGQEIENT
jgi:hypothetical protein